MSTRPSTIKGPKPPTSLHPSCIIAENAILIGTHPITLSKDVIIHPRARLNSTSAPILINEGCIIEEKASIGLLSAQNPQERMLAPNYSSGPGSTSRVQQRIGIEDEEKGEDGDGDDGGGEEGKVKGVILEKGVFVEVGAVVESISVGEGSVVEVKAKLGRGSVLGKHCKIGPLCKVEENEVLQDGTVLYGNGERRIESGLGDVWEKRLRVGRLRVEVERGLVKGDLEKWRS